MGADFAQLVVADDSPQTLAVLEGAKREVARLLRQDNFLEAATHKGMLIEGFEVGRKLDLPQVGAAVEYIAADEMDIVGELDGDNLRTPRT